MYGTEALLLSNKQSTVTECILDIDTEDISSILSYIVVGLPVGNVIKGFIAFPEWQAV